MTREREGVLFALLAAAAYSTSAILARLAYDDGVNLMTLLACRYAGAGAIFWLIVARVGTRLPGRRAALEAFLLGALVVAPQGALFFAALQRIEVARAVLLLYAFPALVAVGAVLLGRERASPRRFAALAVAIGGVALVLSGGEGSAAGGDLLGAGLALASAFACAAYLLIGHGLMRTQSPLVLAALTCSGAGLAYLLVGLGGGLLRFEASPAGWASIAGVTLISTVVAIGTNFAAMLRIGPTVTSIISTAEIPLGVLLAAVVLGERLAPVQLLGGALVVAAVLLVELPLGRPRRRASRSAAVGRIPET